MCSILRTRRKVAYSLYTPSASLFAAESCAFCLVAVCPLVASVDFGGSFLCLRMFGDRSVTVILRQVSIRRFVCSQVARPSQSGQACLMPASRARSPCVRCDDDDLGYWREEPPKQTQRRKEQPLQKAPGWRKTIQLSARQSAVCIISLQPPSVTCVSTN